MKNIFSYLSLLLCFSYASLHAQIENVIVEKYYVSDALDSADTIGGHLPLGSITYRVYIDLKKGSRIRKIYGDAYHALIIKSSAVFFNNMEPGNGQSFGKDISKSRYFDQTTALDTWLTLGVVSKSSVKAYFGIPKPQDTDGSFVGGIHNSEGLLTNTDPSAGIPLTTSDGITTSDSIPQSWGDYGIKDVITLSDSTIFGSIVPDSVFISNDAGLFNSKAIGGVNPDSNQVLVAQLTTLGKISFELNLEVDTSTTSTPKIVHYVANGDTLLPGEILSPFLKYPAVCGCKDPHFLEYSNTYACNDSSACKTPIIFGCMDTIACNYDPAANFNLISLCCYPGYCNDRDLSVVCPSLNNGKYSLYPNPVQEQMMLNISSPDDAETKYEIYDSFGNLVSEKPVNIVSGTTSLLIDVSGFKTGLYLFRLYKGENSQNKMFLKK